MNLSEHFTAVLKYKSIEYPKYAPVGRAIAEHCPGWLYSSIKGLTQQYESMSTDSGLIWYMDKDLDATEFQLLAMHVDKTTMYFEKVSFDVFKASFIEARPEVKRELASMMRLDMEAELDAILAEEYADSYNLYTTELYSYRNKKCLNKPCSC